MSDTRNMGDDPRFAKLLDRITKAGEEFAQIALMASDDAAQNCTLLIAATIGPLAALTVQSARDAKSRPITSDNVLFAALLVASAVEPVSDDGVKLEFHRGIILDAMQAFEKLTGKKPDDMLNKHMVSAARAVENESVTVLDDWLKTHPRAPSSWN